MNAGKAIKRIVGAFIIGGAFALIGQGFATLYAGLLISWGQAESPYFIIYNGALTLVSLGLVGAILFVIGWYKKLEEIGGWGTILPFNGLAVAIAATTTATKKETEDSGKSLSAGFMAMLYVVGLGCIVTFVIALVAFLAS